MQAAGGKPQSRAGAEREPGGIRGLTRDGSRLRKRSLVNGLPHTAETRRQDVMCRVSSLLALEQASASAPIVASGLRNEYNQHQAVGRLTGEPLAPLAAHPSRPFSLPPCLGVGGKHLTANSPDRPPGALRPLLPPPPPLPRRPLPPAMWGEGALGELASAPLHPRLTDPVNALTFDPAEEALWAGTEGGLVCQLVCPSLDLYSSFPAHQVRPAARLIVHMLAQNGCWRSRANSIRRLATCWC